MDEELDSYLGVVPIIILKYDDELLVDYNYRKKNVKKKIPKRIQNVILMLYFFKYF